MRLNQVTFPVADIARARAFWLKLGFALIVDSPHYCRFETPEGEATLSISLNPEAAGSGPKVYFEYESAEALDFAVALYERNGIEFETAPEDQSWLWREAQLTDPDGNRLILYYAGENRLNPPWRV